MVFSFPDLEHIKDYVLSHYPCNIDIADGDLLSMLENVANDMGKSDLRNPSEYILKALLNRSLSISDKWEKKLDSMEMAFICE